MRTTILLSLPLTLLLALLAMGCDNKPAQPAPAAAPAVAAVPAAVPAVPAVPADAKLADAAKAAEEEGCIYKDAQKEEEAGCPHGGAEHAAPASTVPGHFGAVFAIKETRPLAQVLASGKEFKDPVQVSGQVDSVCQKKGCWLVVKDGEAQARILMKDHSFTVPMDSKGQKVVVEGTIEARTFNEAQVKHLEKDAGKDPAGVAGERTEYVLTATAIELKNT